MISDKLKGDWTVAVKLKGSCTPPINLNTFKSTMEIVNQNDKKRNDINFTDGRTIPDKVIFNGDNTVVVYGDKKIVLHKSEEDKYDPVYAFLYAYFIHNSGCTKTQASKVMNVISETAKKEEKKTVQDKVNEVAEAIGKNLDFDTYVKEMNKILNK